MQNNTVLMKRIALAAVILVIVISVSFFFLNYTRQGAVWKATSFAKNEETYKFDGIEETFKVKDVLTLRCPFCWSVEIEYQSRSSGYGNRSEQVVAQVITTHIARIMVNKGKITYAVLDEKWDMISQRYMERIKENAEGREYKPVSPEQKIDLSTIKKYPSEGDYLSSDGYNTKILLSGGEYPTTLDSKILLLDYSLNYATLKNEDICLRYTANPGDPGVLIRGTLKNEYDRDYWIILGAATYDSTENLLGRSLDSGPVCGIIARYVKSNKTENFELHLKYSNAISKINLSGGLSEIMPP